MQSNDGTIKKFPTIPFPDEMLISGGRNKLIQDEIHFDKVALRQDYEKLSKSLTVEQQGV